MFILVRYNLDLHLLGIIRVKRGINERVKFYVQIYISVFHMCLCDLFLSLIKHIPEIMLRRSVKILTQDLKSNLK